MLFFYAIFSTTRIQSFGFQREHLKAIYGWLSFEELPSKRIHLEKCRIL